MGFQSVINLNKTDINRWRESFLLPLSGRWTSHKWEQPKGAL
jgi:hypothetical protein